MLKKILIIGGIVIFLAGAGAAAYFFIFRKAPEEVPAATESVSENEFEENTFEDLVSEAENINMDNIDEPTPTPTPEPEVEEVSPQVDVLFDFPTEPALAPCACYKIHDLDGSVWSDDNGKEFKRTADYTGGQANDKGCFAEFESDDGTYYAVVRITNSIPSEIESTQYIVVEYDDWLSVSDVEELQPAVEEEKPVETTEEPVQEEEKKDEEDTGSEDGDSDEDSADHEHYYAVCYNNGNGTLTLTCTVPGCSETKIVTTAECPPHVWPVDSAQLQAEVVAIVNDYINKYRPEFKYLCSNTTPYIYLYNGTYFVEYFGPNRSKWAEAWINSYTGKVLNVVKN